MTRKTETPDKNSNEVFVDYQCVKCDNGNHPCVNRNRDTCEYLHPRRG